MVDKNKAFIYKNFLLLLDNQQKLIEEIKNINQITQSYFKGCCDSEREDNLKNALLISKNQNGEDIMKFQGLTIKRNITCDTWYTRIRKDGKQHYISGRTQRECLNKVKDFINYVQKEKNKNVTFEKWYKQWLEMFKIGKVKKVTIEDYEKTLKNFPTELWQKDIKKITSIEILEVLNKVTKERTKQKLYELLNAIFEKAEIHSIIQNNIFKIIDKPKHKKEKGIALNHNQQIEFIQSCRKNELGDLFLLILYQGLRIGEALAITGNDFNLVEKTLTINKSINRYNEVDDTKNEQSCRNTNLFDKSISILQKYKNFKNERIFNISYSVAQKNLKRVLDGTNLPNISIHDLRHTFITNCKDENIPEHIIQSWVGHEIGSKVTSQRYTHTNQEISNKFINLLNEKNIYKNG